MPKGTPTKTAAEKAQEDLERAERKVAKLKERLKATDELLDAIHEDLVEAEKTRNYIAQHPALTQPTVVEPIAVEPQTTDVPDVEPAGGEIEGAGPQGDDGVVGPLAAQEPTVGPDGLVKAPSGTPPF